MKKLLIVNDIGAYTPSLKALSEVARLYSYIPRPSAISKPVMETINRYCHGVLKEESAFGLDGYVHPERATITSVDAYAKTEDETVADIVQAARLFGVDGIIFGGFEPLVRPVARAAEILGLRSAGVEAAKLARNKLLMREAFRKHNVPSPDFRGIRTEQDLIAAVKEIGYPLILKPTFLAGSIGVTLLDGSRDPVAVYREVRASVLGNISDQMLFEDDCLFLAEEFMEGCNEDWYNNPFFGDYVSVEGMMIQGRFHPVAITDKSPINKPSFTETAHIAPSILDDEAQAIIIDAVTRANECLGLENCPIHTEVKLMKGRQVGIIETAARFGGWNIIPQIQAVFGIDLSKAWAEVMLHGDTDLIPRSAAKADRARANMRIYVDFSSHKGGQGYVYLGHQKLDGFLEDQVRIVAEAELSKGSVVSSVASQDSFTFVSTIDLEGPDPASVAQTVQNIKRGARLKLQEMQDQAERALQLV